MKKYLPILLLIISCNNTKKDGVYKGEQISIGVDTVNFIATKTDTAKVKHDTLVLKDIFYIHDTIYKNRNTNIGNANTVNIGQ